MSDSPFPRDEQKRRFGVVWDDIYSFDEFMDFWSFYELLVKSAPANSTIVEVGCYCGRSLVCLDAFAREADKGLRIVGVDNNAMGVNTALTSNLQRLQRPIEFIDGHSVDAAARFADNSIYAVFIDGGHVHDDVEADVQAWMPKIQPGGWLTGHDFLMHTVHQPVRAYFGDRLIWDERWRDVWIVPKCELDLTANTRVSAPDWPVKKTWRP